MGEGGEWGWEATLEKDVENVWGNWKLGLLANT